MRVPSLFGRGGLHWFIDHAANNKNEGTLRQGRRLTYNAIESGGNEFLVWLVASAGFFTDSYILFASNAIVPMLSFVYWPTVVGPAREEVINIATLAGCIVGMILFGVLGDVYGRRKMYGIELVVLVFGTVGVLMSSNGFATGDGLDGSMDIQSWLVFFRFVSGVGIGGDYPLSAVIVSEFAPKAKRARMLASVFAMQACGILAASVVSLVVVCVVQAQNPNATPQAVDHIWRWIMGLGLVPALFSVVIRLNIPESPRYTLDVLDDPYKAFEEANRFNESNLQDAFNLQANLMLVSEFSQPVSSGGRPNAAHLPGTAADEPRRAQQSSPPEEAPTKYTVRGYFWSQGNWRYLFGTASTWFLLDFAFYGLGLSSPKAVSKIWYNGVLSSSAVPPSWDITYADPSKPAAVIFSILKTSAWHSLVVVSIGAILGSVTLVVFIDRLNRKRLQWRMFIALGFLFIITGATYRIGNNGVTITLYVICQMAFYFGPNGLTFIIPAELFPTKYRTSCHGLSAASGKFGSVIVQIFLAYVKFGHGRSKTSWLSPNAPWFGYVLLIFAAPMFLGALITWWFIPDLQAKDGQSLSLEMLAEGRPHRKPRDPEAP